MLFFCALHMAYLVSQKYIFLNLMTVWSIFLQLLCKNSTLDKKRKWHQDKLECAQLVASFISVPLTQDPVNLSP